MGRGRSLLREWALQIAPPELSTPWEGRHRKHSLKQRRRTADYILWCQQHTIADTFGVVQNIEMAEAGRLWHRRGARRKLDINNIVNVESRGRPRARLNVVTVSLLQHVLKGMSAANFVEQLTTSWTRIVHNNQILETRHSKRLEHRSRRLKVDKDVLEQAEIGLGGFSGDFGFG